MDVEVGRMVDVLCVVGRAVEGLGVVEAVVGGEE